MSTRLITQKQKAILTARKLRKNQTKAELIFWNVVKDKKIHGYKFLRQHPLYYQFYGENRFFIADFYCSRLNLIIEIDGGIHEKQADYDQLRSEILEVQKHIKVIRYKNKDVINNKNKILNNLNSIMGIQ